MEGGPDATLRVQTLLHETAHYAQDLALGAAVEHDFLLDQSLGVLLQALSLVSAGRDVQLPLSAEPQQMDGPTREAYAFVVEREALAGQLFDATLVVMFQGEARPYEVSGHALMESLAAGQAARSLRNRCRSDEDRRHLAEMGELIQIVPASLGPPYDTASGMLGLALGRFSDATDDAAWPWDSAPASASGMADVAAALLADIACQVPPVEIMVQRREAGRNDWDDFLPGHRFVKALMAIQRAGTFPDSPPDEGADGMYRVLFDTVAAAWDWPTWQETIESWLAKVAVLKQHRRSAGDAYRYRLLVERLKRPGGFALGDPLFECFRQGVPVLHLTPTGMKILSAYLGENQTVLTPFEMEDGLTAMHWLTRDVEPWQDLVGPVSVVDASRHQTQQAVPLFLQEVVARALGRAFQAAVLRGPAFHCPFANGGCAAARPECGELRHLGAAPSSGCALRTWMGAHGLRPERFTWTERRS